LELDNFLGSARGSIEREQMTQSSDHFEKYYQQKENIEDFLQQIVEAEPGETVEVNGTYNRQNKGQLDGVTTFTRPEEKTVLLLEGTNTARFLSKVDLPEGVRMHRSMVGVYPVVAMLKALLRDLDEGKEKRKAAKEGRPPSPRKTPEQVLRTRAREMGYTLKQWRENLESEYFDTILWRTKKNHSIIEEFDQYIKDLNEQGVDISKEMIGTVVDEEVDAFWESQKNAEEPCECGNYVRIMQAKIKEAIHRNDVYEEAEEEVLDHVKNIISEKTSVEMEE